MRSRQITFACAVVIAAALPLTASAVGMKELVLLAFDGGRAEGELSDRAAETMRATTASSEPVRAVVEVIERNAADPSCGRIRVSMSQSGVPTTDGGFVRYEQSFRQNICAGGGLPPGLSPGFEFEPPVIRQ